MIEPNLFFHNSFEVTKEKIYILSSNDNYASNFGKQWKKYKNIQIDSINNFDISKNFLEEILFNDLKILKNKNVLEIGCGAGRFTEHIVKYAKLCVSVDLSSSIFYNVAKTSKNLILIKSDLMHLLPNKKFDIVICRGVLQHTPDPLKSIIKLYDFIDNHGKVYFDIYPMPKIGFFHPKYFFWRPLIKLLYKYEDFEILLEKRIKILLKIKRKIKIIFFNSDFISDTLIPIWDYKNKIILHNSVLEKWSILDTLDGIYAKFDKPQRFTKIKKFLKKNNIKIINYKKKKNIFETTRLF